MARFLLVLCASALFVSAISGQCIGNIGSIGYGLGAGNYAAGLAGAEIAAAGLGLGGLGARVAGAELAAAGLAGGYLGAPVLGYNALAAPAISASGGGLAISSASPIAPSGISVVSENAIEGALSVSGQLPLLAAVALEGAVPSAGAAGVTYSCGNGNVGIASESLAAAGMGYGIGNVGLGYGIGNAGLAGAFVGGEIAGLNAGLGYGIGNAGLGYGIGNAGLAGAFVGGEIAGLNAGLGAGYGSGLINVGPNCAGIYY